MHCIHCKNEKMHFGNFIQLSHFYLHEFICEIETMFLGVCVRGCLSHFGISNSLCVVEYNENSFRTESVKYNSHLANDNFYF